MVIKVDPECTYLVSPDFTPSNVPEGYIWDETAFVELVKATDKATADQSIYTYGGAQGDAETIYNNVADLTISDEKYNGEGQVVDTTITANAFNNAGTVTTDGAITFSLQDFSNSGTFELDINGVLNATGAVTNAEAGTIDLNAGSTLTGSTVVNSGTITVVSDHAAINGAISNHGMIDAMMKKLTVAGDIRNAEADDTAKARDNSVIKSKEFEVTGNVTNYGVIGVEIKPDHTVDISGKLSNYRQVIVDILNAGSIRNDGIYSGEKETHTQGYIEAGEVNAGSLDNVSGLIRTTAPKETAPGVNVTGTINNGNADNVYAVIDVGLNGWIQAASLNNIGTDYENSKIKTAKLTVGDIVNNGGISARIVGSTGTITNNATGLFFISYIDNAELGFLEAASLTAEKIINGGTFTVCSEAALPTPIDVTSFENSGTFELSGAGFTLTGDIFNKTEGQLDVAGTVTGGTGSITNSGTLNISNADDVSGVLTIDGAVKNAKTGTINLNAGTTLQGTTIGNAGTITVVSDHATINGAITNHGIIDATKRKLIVVGDLQNANEDDTAEARDNTVITAREFEVTGNVENYGIIGTEWKPDHEITISGELRNYRQVMADILTAGSIYNNEIYSDIKEERAVGYIVVGQITTGEINNVVGTISAGEAQEQGIGINVSGKINNGKVDNDDEFNATIQAGDDGWIQAVDALNNIGATSYIHSGEITVVKGAEAGDLTNDGRIAAKNITVDGTITNRATGIIDIGGSAEIPGNLSATSIANAGVITLADSGTTLTGDVVNSNQFNFEGTVNATGSIMNAETGTISIKSAGAIADTGTITNSGTLHIAILEGNETKITADKFTNTEGIGKITIGGSCDDGITTVISAQEGDVKVSDITVTATAKSGGEVTAATRGGTVVLVSGVDYGTIYLSNGIDEAADFAKEVKDSSGAFYYVDINAFRLPASALADGVKDTTATILIDGTNAAALQYASETTASIDGLAFAKDGTNAATPENEEKNVEFVLTGMDPADPESRRELKKGITVGAGVTLTADKLYQSGKDAVTNIDGELRTGTSNSGAKAVVVIDAIEVAAGQVNVNGGGALYDCTVVSGGTVTVQEGGYAGDIKTENGGRLDVCEGGVASSATVSFGGNLYVSDGGQAIQIMEDGGYVSFDEEKVEVTFVANSFSGLTLYGPNRATVHSGTTAIDITVNDEGSMSVYDGGVANAVIINRNGVLSLQEGGFAEDATVNVGGGIRVSSGGSALRIMENGGYVNVLDGANVSFVSNTISGLELNEYECATVHSGTTATDVSVNSECDLEVFDGGIADVVEVNADGSLLVHRDGKANGVTVNSGGTAEVSSSGVIDGAVVNAGGGLLIYNGAKLTGRMTFESGAEVIPFVGSILDFDLTQTAADADALVNDLSVLMGKPSYTLTVDGSERNGTYNLAGGASNFNETITVVNTSGTELGTLTVNGEDLSISGKTYQLKLTGSDLFVTVAPSNRPDDGTNDLLYDKSNKTWNDANITVENRISASSLEKDNTVYLDVPGSIDQMHFMYNMVGYNTPDPDTGDTARISVHDPAKLTFQIDSTVAGTFFVYEKVYDKKNGAYKQVQIGKVSVKKNKPAYLKDVCITAGGDCFVQMAANSGAYKKEGSSGYYNVTISSAEFFDDVDNGWNDSYASALVQVEPATIGRGTTFIGLDDNVESADDWNFVGGITDMADYARISLESSTFLSFDVIGDDAISDGTAKFTIWKFNGTKGLKKVSSVTLKDGKYAQTTKGVFLDKDEQYYISVESPDAAKGKAVSYRVEVNTLGTRFFDSADDNRNDVLYDKKHRTVYDESAAHHFVVNAVSSISGGFVLDDNVIGLEGFENFVGYGDKVDYAKFTVTEKGKLTFTVTATEGATFEVYKFNAAKGKLESLGKTKLKLGRNATCTGTVSNLLLDVGTEYYVSMTAAKTTANTRGSVFYNVTAALDAENTMPQTASVASALAMPETASSVSALAMPETASSASALEMPMASAAYADSVQDKLFGESGTGLLASL